MFVASNIVIAKEEEANCGAKAGAPSERKNVLAEPLVAVRPIVAVGLAPVEIVEEGA